MEKIWERLGELTAQAKASQDQRDELVGLVRDMSKDMSKQTTLIQTTIVSGHARLENLEDEMIVNTKSIKSLNKSRNNLKIWIAGGLGGSGTIGGAIGTFFSKYFS